MLFAFHVRDAAFRTCASKTLNMTIGEAEEYKRDNMHAIIKDIVTDTEAVADLIEKIWKRADDEKSMRV